MTDKEINERVAAITGFHNTVGLMKRGFWYRPNGCGYTACECEAGRYTMEAAKKHEYKLGDEPVEIKRFKTPNYAESLDACRGFESTFDPNDSSEYAVQLRRIVTWNAKDIEKHPDTGYVPDGRYYCATPIERCEAFLRMKGQWE